MWRDYRKFKTAKKASLGPLGKGQKSVPQALGILGAYVAVREVDKK